MIKHYDIHNRDCMLMQCIKADHTIIHIDDETDTMYWNIDFKDSNDETISTIWLKDGQIGSIYELCINHKRKIFDYRDFTALQ